MWDFMKTLQKGYEKTPRIREGSLDRRTTSLALGNWLELIMVFPHLRVLFPVGVVLDEIAQKQIRVVLTSSSRCNS